MKTNRKPEYITVQGQRLKTTGREITIHEVEHDGEKGVAIMLNGKDVEFHAFDLDNYKFLRASIAFMVSDVLCSLFLVQGQSANEIHDYLARLADYGITRFDQRIPAEMMDEADRFAEFVKSQGLSEEELTDEKLKELVERFKNENA